MTFRTFDIWSTTWIDSLNNSTFLSPWFLKFSFFACIMWLLPYTSNILIIVFLPCYKNFNVFFLFICGDIWHIEYLCCLVCLCIHLRFNVTIIYSTLCFCPQYLFHSCGSNFPFLMYHVLKMKISCLAWGLATGLNKHALLLLLVDFSS